MKKTWKVAVAASVLAGPAMAANLENPLYLPTQGEIYSKTGFGVMYKKADSTQAHILKKHDGAEEFPIWRFSEDIGYGITDRIAVHGSFGYTKDGDIDRKGMHQGRIGMTYRAFDEFDDFIWDWYADIHMGGVSKMTGEFQLLSMSPLAGAFQYDNYSNGRWGFHAGTKFGKTWSGFTAAAFAEIQQTFGNHNNEIRVDRLAAAVNGMGGDLPNDITVDLKSTTEFNAGFKAFYEFDEKWSLGGGFTYKHHVDNGVESVHTALNMANPVNNMVVNSLLAQLENMNDGFDEYIVSVSVARQMTDAIQVALYGEYTFDTAHAMSQNGTDVKAEAGVRLNVRF